MLEQLLLVEQAHKQTLDRLEDEKHNHREYMKKSDDLTNLLEQERERLKLLNDQEKSFQEQKEEENNTKITNLKEELTKLKSFALLVIDEQQHVSEQLAQQTAKVQALHAAARESEEELNSVQSRAQKMESKVLHLEAELHGQAVQFHKEQEVLSTKLADENRQNRHLLQTLSALSKEKDELEKSNKAFHRVEEELQQLRDKNSKGEIGNSSLVSELEELRKRVVDMEEKDEELIKMDNLCWDLNRKLEKESLQNQSLKAEVDKLNNKIAEVEKLEDAFEKSKQEISSLKCNLEKERAVTNYMCNELDNLRIRIKELEAAECLLEKTEWTLKEDLTKLKTLTVMLIDERKNMAEKLKQLENKFQDSTDKLQEEKDKVTLVTEKLIEESKNALKIKVEMEEKICITNKERDDIKVKLKTEEEKSNALQFKVNLMKKRLQSLEAVEREFFRNKTTKEENITGPIQNGFQHEDNKMKDLTQEEEWLRRKLRDNMLEENLLKTQTEGESLDKRYCTEKALMEELAIARKELYKYHLIEKENFNQEHILYKQLKEEETKSSHLTKEVEALKEKIHSYMGTEGSICNMKSEYASLQRKLTQQEIRNKELVREKESLTSELERYRHFSKSLRPGMIGRRFSDLQVSTKEVQTEPTNTPTPTYRNLSLLEQAVVDENMHKESNQQYEPNYNKINPAICGTSLKNSNNYQNNTKQIKNPLLKSVEKQQLIRSKIQNTLNGSHTQQVVTHNLSQYQNIKMTPDHSHKTATCKTTNTTIANVPNSRKQQISIVQKAPISPENNKCHPFIETLSTSEQSITPHNITIYSQTGISEFTSLLTPDSAMLPTEITAITTGASDRSQETDIKAGHTMFCETPQKQNNWHTHRYNSSRTSVIKDEDNKLHIHLGIPYLQTINSNTEPPCSSSGQEQRSSVITSGIPAKVNSKIANTIRIKPASSPIPQPSQIAVPVEAFMQSGPTRIPKPKAYSTPTGTNSRIALTQSRGTAQALPKGGKTYTVI
ncbi:filamin A-interacting protein 1-like isoform X2 [Tachysurus fulvidraco]|nr:filamin A-interacting protein 1-like isoform X2 [Tachysurus fulvidraco]